MMVLFCSKNRSHCLFYTLLGSFLTLSVLEIFKQNLLQELSVKKVFLPITEDNIKRGVLISGLKTTETSSIFSETNGSNSNRINITTHGVFEKTTLPSRLRGKKTTTKHGPHITRQMAAFEPIMSKVEKQSIFLAMLKIKEICNKYNFTWMLYSGALLGSWRHHDIIPWDDDLDILVNVKHKSGLLKALMNTKPNFGVFRAGSRVKFWASEGSFQFLRLKWKWPFVDINFYKENKTHIWDASMEEDYGDRYYEFAKEMVFPLHDRLLWKYLFPAPRDSLHNLRHTYRVAGINICMTLFWSHRSELPQPVQFRACDSLKDKYAFVHRSLAANGTGIFESLQLAGTEIHRVFVKEPTYAITHPYNCTEVKQSKQ